MTTLRSVHATPSIERAEAITLVDAHVHLHPAYPVAAFLDAAFTNFGRFAEERFGGTPFVGVLCLTEGSGTDAFGHLKRLSETETSSSAPELGRWKVHPTSEDTSLELLSGTGDRMFLIAGFQIRTGDGLEVLTLGTRNRLSDGRPITATLDAAGHDGALPIVPWGFGKWTGRRGQAVRALLRESGPRPLFLGDNANRPVLHRRSPLFRFAEAHGVRDLPGSDTLPFRGEYRRVGCAGLVLGGTIDEGNPTQDLKDRLVGGPAPVSTFLQRESPIRFVRNQIAMQQLKRSKPWTEAAS